MRRVRCSASGFGITPNPSRQPVIAYDFEKPSRMIVWRFMPGKARDRGELALVEEARVDLVRQHRHAVVARELGDPAHVLGAQHAAGRVVGRVDDEELGLLGDAPLELLQVEAEAGLLEQGDRHRLPAHEVDHRLVDREPGVRVDDLVARVRERHDGEEHDRLGARRHHDLVRLDRNAARLLDVLGDRLAQLGQAGRRPVVGGPRVERPLGRVADVRRRVEVRLADLQVHDRLALALERPRPRQHLEGGLGAEPPHPLRDHRFDHASSSSARTRRTSRTPRAAPSPSGRRREPRSRSRPAARTRGARAPPAPSAPRPPRRDRPPPCRRP